MYVDCTPVTVIAASALIVVLEHIREIKVVSNGPASTSSCSTDPDNSGLDPIDQLIMGRIIVRLRVFKLLFSHLFGVLVHMSTESSYSFDRLPCIKDGKGELGYISVTLVR